MNLDQAMGGIKTVTTNGKTGGGDTFDWVAKHYRNKSGCRVVMPANVGKKK